MDHLNDDQPIYHQDFGVPFCQTNPYFPWTNQQIGEKRVENTMGQPWNIMEQYLRIEGETHDFTMALSQMTW